jgi:hypothetical protein
MTMEPILASESTPLGDYRRYPGCRLQLVCGRCGWSKAYDPERVIQRLHDLRVAGHPTALRAVASRVAWYCPSCLHSQWRARFAWPEGISPREIKRLTNLYRN